MWLWAERIRGQLALSPTEAAGVGSVFIGSHCPSGRSAVIAFDRTCRMLARANVLCGRAQDAEDAVAEAYEKAFKRWNRCLCRNGQAPHQS
jgi:hypothetical protein